MSTHFSGVRDPEWHYFFRPLIGRAISRLLLGDRFLKILQHRYGVHSHGFCLTQFRETFWLARNSCSTEVYFIERIWGKSCVDTNGNYHTFAHSVTRDSNFKIRVFGTPKWQIPVERRRKPGSFFRMLQYFCIPKILSSRNRNFKNIVVSNI